MRFAHVDRLWLIGGAVGAVALLALAWFLLISPQNGETAALLDQTASTQDRITTLHHKLAELRAQNGDLPRYQARLAQDRLALPSAPGLSDFLRELQTAGDASGAKVTALQAGGPADLTAAGTHVSALAVTITAIGSTGQLNGFLAQLQDVQPRAALIDTVRTDGTASAATMTISLHLFVGAESAAAVGPK